MKGRDHPRRDNASETDTPGEGNHFSVEPPEEKSRALCYTMVWSFRDVLLLWGAIGLAVLLLYWRVLGRNFICDDW